LFVYNHIGLVEAESLSHGIPQVTGVDPVLDALYNRRALVPEDVCDQLARILDDPVRHREFLSRKDEGAQSTLDKLQTVGLVTFGYVAFISYCRGVECSIGYRHCYP